MPPVMLADALILPPLNISNINTHNICVSATTYAKDLREHADYMHARRAEVLNMQGRIIKALTVSDYVKTKNRSA